MRSSNKAEYFASCHRKGDGHVLEEKISCCLVSTLWFFLTAAIWALSSPVLTMPIRDTSSFFVVLSFERTVCLRKTKTIAMQCNTMSSEISLLIHLLCKWELNQHNCEVNSWSSLFVLKAEENPRKVTLNAIFLSFFIDSLCTVQY